VVVDDGSTDDSREIIASYGSDVVAVLKENGGQASAFNVGLEAASGNLVIFLDADDILLPEAIERVLEACADPDVAQASWQMREFGEGGRPGENLFPPEQPPDGDVRDTLIRDGPGAIDSAPTSGNAWSRRFLDAIFPIPERGLERAGADAYMSTLAPMYGTVVRVHQPLSAFRKHSGSNYGGSTFDVRLAMLRLLYERCCEGLERECRQRGLPIDRERWDRESWVCALEDLVHALHQHVPPGHPFVLIDDNQFDMDETGGRPAVPLIAKDGVYWGSPENDAAAIAALDAHIAHGIAFLALAPPSRWWLEEYRGFFRHLAQSGHVVLDDERLTLYRLSGAHAA
jgi:hypothetical protein